MVKTTYAFTLFTAVSLAAPVQQLARDGTGNLIGAGDADGAMNQAVGKIFKDLSPRDTEGQGSGKHRNIIDGIPIVNTLLGVCIQDLCRRSMLTCRNRTRSRSVT